MAFLHAQIEGKIAVITINRPPANALSQELLLELDEVLTEFSTNDDVRVIVIRGEGKFFCAGADIREFTTIGSQEKAYELARNGQQLMDKIEQYPKPIIASIHGAALGGGLELAMGCHIRLVSENAKLGLPELSLGIIPGFAGTQRLPKYVGEQKALEMMITSEPISGTEACQYGLALRAFPEEKLFEETMKLAEKFASKSPASVRAVINLLKYTKTEQFAEGIEQEAKWFSEVFRTEDAKEGIQAFIEKRKPNFVGK